MAGASSARAEFEEQGFTVIRRAVDPELVREASSHVEWLTRKYPDLRPEHFHHPLIRNDAFWVRLVTDEGLLEPVRELLGPDLACFTAHYICKPPRDGQAVLWHQDAAYWKLEPMRAASAWLAIDASTPENGCLRMIPGSHRLPVLPISVRNDTPNMLSSITDEDVVAEWADRNGLVDVVLEPGDLSIHHPHILHYSEPNRSDRRRCGLDIGYIPTSTRIANEGLYLDPILVSGSAVPGVNRYRPWPRYAEGETVPFRGHEEWNKRIAALNAEGGFAEEAAGAETPIEVTHRMMRRLQEGTVRQ